MCVCVCECVCVFCFYFFFFIFFFIFIIIIIFFFFVVVVVVLKQTYFQRYIIIFIILFYIKHIRNSVFYVGTSTRQAVFSISVCAKSMDCRENSENRYWHPAFKRQHITKTRLFKCVENFTTKNWKFSAKKLRYFSYFCSKHRLWLLVRTASLRRF